MATSPPSTCRVVATANSRRRWPRSSVGYTRTGLRSTTKSGVLAGPVKAGPSKPLMSLAGRSSAPPQARILTASRWPQRTPTPEPRSAASVIPSVRPCWPSVAPDTPPRSTEMEPTAPEEKELSAATDRDYLIWEIAEGLDESARNDRNNGFPEAADETEDMADALRHYHARAQRIEAALHNALGVIEELTEQLGQH